MSNYDNQQLRYSCFSEPSLVRTAIPVVYPKVTSILNFLNVCTAIIILNLMLIGKHIQVEKVNSLHSML